MLSRSDEDEGDITVRFVDSHGLPATPSPKIVEAFRGVAYALAGYGIPKVGPGSDGSKAITVIHEGSRTFVNLDVRPARRHRKEIEALFVGMRAGLGEPYMTIKTLDAPDRNPDTFGILDLS